MEANVKYYSMNPLQKIGYKIYKFFRNFPSHFISWLKRVGLWFEKVWFNIGDSLRIYFKALVDGDWATKLSFLFLGVGSFKRKQYLKGILYLLIEGIFIYFLITFMIPNFAKLDLQDLVKAENVYNPDTGKNEWNNYDNTFLILLYSIMSIILIIAFIVFYFKSIKSTYNIELVDRNGGHINTFKEDANLYLNKKFHVTLLVLPILGVLVFTVIPLIFMVCIAFTNYDGDHLPPTYLFSWVGWDNFANLFGGQIVSNFSYAFQKSIWWTFVWAFFATFTNYIGGILLALLINNKRTRVKKLWRTLFVITIAVPQFVTLMLIRYFLNNNGIMNTILNQIGLISWLKSIGAITTSYLPFLSDPNWIKVMVIIINMWVGFPYLMLIATGILMNIPNDLYESAKIDGAGKFKMFSKITMPYMLFVTGPYLISQFTSNFNNFNVIYLLTSGYSTTDIKLGSVSCSEADLLVTWLFKLTTEDYDYKMASVIGIMIFVVSATFTLIAFGIINNKNKEERFQ
ncbi:MAG: sugar ABC transporter permease [Bacilli bacterium]